MAAKTRNKFLERAGKSWKTTLDIFVLQFCKSSGHGGERSLPSCEPLKILRRSYQPFNAGSLASHDP